MNISRKTMLQSAFGVALVVLFAMPAMANPTGNTASAGFTGLPLRASPSIYGAQVRTLVIGEQLNILRNDWEHGWSYVEAPGSGQKGWVCNQNTY